MTITPATQRFQIVIAFIKILVIGAYIIQRSATAVAKLERELVAILEGVYEQGRQDEADRPPQDRVAR